MLKNIFPKRALKRQLKIAEVCLILLIFLNISSLSAREYNASFFGIKSDGVTNNTTSLQKAVDYINSQGGGTLVFYVGRYLTGTVYLKSNVAINLKEGAIIVGSFSPYDYDISTSKESAIFVGNGQNNIKIFGDGVIEGGGMRLYDQKQSLKEKGFLNQSPSIGLFKLDHCVNVDISGLNLWYGNDNIIQVKDSRVINLTRLHMDGRGVPENTGINLENSDWVTLQDLFVQDIHTPLRQSNQKTTKIVNSITSDGKAIKPE